VRVHVCVCVCVCVRVCVHVRVITCLMSQPRASRSFIDRAVPVPLWLLPSRENTDSVHTAHRGTRLRSSAEPRFSNRRPHIVQHAQDSSAEGGRARKCQSEKHAGTSELGTECEVHERDED